MIAPVFGFIQFAAIYAEFAYLFDSVFRAHMYAMFGFLLINFLLLIVIIALLSIISTYTQLCNQNYEWWWRSFVVGGSGGIYLAIYAVIYAFTTLKLSDVASDVGFIVYSYIFICLYICAAGFVS